MIQSRETAYLLERLRYAYNAPAVTTMGYCVTGCGKPARGGGTCPDCLVADLVKLGVPKAQAQAYQSILAQIQRLRIEAEELAEKITAPPPAESPSPETGIRNTGQPDQRPHE